MLQHLVRFLGMLATSHAFASYFTTDEFCERALTPGEVIMNNIAELSTARSVTVYRLDNDGVALPLENGAEYLPGETLQIGLSDISDEFVLEAENGFFAIGGCDGRRSTVGGKMSINSATTADVVIKAGWASGHGVVSISEPFRLKALPSSSGRLLYIRSNIFSYYAIYIYFAEADKVPVRKSLSVNLPMKHRNEGAEKLNKSSKKFLRGKMDTAGAVQFDQLWRQYVDSEGFVEKYLTDELINFLLVVAIILCVYTFYRVCRGPKVFDKNH